MRIRVPNGQEISFDHERVSDGDVAVPLQQCPNPPVSTAATDAVEPRRHERNGKEHTIDVTFSDVSKESSVQKGHIVTSHGFEASFVAGKPLEYRGVRIFAGLVSDPFFMDVEATSARI